MAKEGQRVAATDCGELVAYLVPFADQVTLIDRMIATGEYEPDRVAITRAVVETASRLPDPQLRSLGAIHLATALTLWRELHAFVTYDLAGVAHAHDMSVAIPISAG